MSARALLTMAATLALAAAGSADEPGQGPRDTVGTTLKGKKVTVEYGRPPLDGRSVAEMMNLLPAERVWRAGVDQVTSLVTETDLLVSGQKLAAGRYTLYVHAPVSGDWTLIVSAHQGTPLKDMFPEVPKDLADQPWPQLGTYEQIKGKEVARAPLKRGPSPKAPLERFQITLDPEKAGVSAITLAWGDQSWTAELKAAK
jgi:hypothetical protein